MSNGFISDKGTIIGSGNSGNAIGFEETIGTACKNPNGYTVGSYFKGIDGNFYKVTAAISSGDIITVGTNCVQTDIATQLTVINQSCTVYQATLETGETSVTYTSPLIDSNACFDFYADKAHSSLYPSDWSISNHTLTVTYAAQSEDVVVGVQISKGVL